MCAAEAMELNTFIVSAVLLLIAGSLAVALSRHLGLGSVLGLLVAGIIVGPYSPGPHITDQVDDVRHFTELGVVLLLFLVGVEIKPSRLWALRRDVLGMGSLQVIATGLVITGYALFYQPSWKQALVVGFTLALSSTAFVLQMLQERGETRTRHGTAAFAVLLMQDMAIVPLMALLPILSESVAISSGTPPWQHVAVVAGMLVLVLSFGRYVVPFALDRMARQRNREGFLMVVMLAVLLAAWATNRTGLSMAFGAFLMGMMLSGSRFALQIEALIEPYKGLLMSIFFVAVGMSIDVGSILNRPVLFAQHAAVIVAIKVVVPFLLLRAFGYARGVAVRVTAMLSQGGEFGFVLFGSARALGIIDDETFVLGIGVISVSMLATPLMVRIGDALARRSDSRQGAADGHPVLSDHADETPKVLIGGYGRVGHTVATILHSSGVPFIAFDINLERVEQGKKDGYPVFYGDISNPDLLSAAHIGRASLVVLTIDHAELAMRAVSHIREMYPHVRVIARARNLEECARLTEAGVTMAYPEAIEGSLRLGAVALQMAGVASDEVSSLLQEVRGGNYELVSKHRDPSRAGQA
jgi:glutathione-regulated potassium-efflux system protein KefB